MNKEQERLLESIGALCIEIWKREREIEKLKQQRKVFASELQIKYGIPPLEELLDVD